jgi:hypothetical protein
MAHHSNTIRIAALSAVLCSLTLTAAAQDYPSKSVRFVAGTSIHLAAELLQSVAGISLTHVPYRGAAPAFAALVGNEIQLLFDSGTTAIGHIKAGRVRALAIASPARLSVIPEADFQREWAPRFRGRRRSRHPGAFGDAGRARSVTEQSDQHGARRSGLQKADGGPRCGARRWHA